MLHFSSFEDLYAYANGLTVLCSWEVEDYLLRFCYLFSYIKFVVA
jgi:hypothetical protein